MLKFLPMLLVLLVWSACATEEAGVLPDKRALEARADTLLTRMTSNPDPAELAELRGLYGKMLLDTSYSMTQRLNMERFLAEADFSEGQFAKAYERLQDAIHRYPKAGTVPEAALLWAQLAIQHLRKPEVAEMIFAQLRERYPQHSTLKVIPSSYDSTSVQALRKRLQEAIYPPGNQPINRTAGLAYSDVSYAYSAFEPNDSLAAQDHLAIAQVLQQMHTYDLSVRHLDFIVATYPTAVQAPDAMLLKAYILGVEQELKDEGLAAVEELLSAYPQSMAAREAGGLRDKLSGK